MNRSSIVTEPSLVVYACVSRGTMVLAEFNNGDQDLETLALQCLENIPHYHHSFSHTIRNRIYCFYIVDPFVYFGIFEEELGKIQAFQFLERVKTAFVKTSKKAVGKGLDHLKPRCFHEEFANTFRRLLSSRELRSLKSPDVSVNQNGMLDSKLSGKKAISVPLLGNMSTKTKKKNKIPAEEMMNDGTRDITIENKVDVLDEGNLTRDFSASMQKNGSYIGHTGRHHARKMWRQQVWTVLLIDLVVCCILFGIWLFICKGFRCIR
ncbi:hypothetical protein ACHQM5_027349 [Ranunculus cassubicifolius]